MSRWKRALGAIVFAVCLWEEWSLLWMPASVLGGAMMTFLVMAVMVVGYSGLLLMLGKDPRRPNDD